MEAQWATETSSVPFDHAAVNVTYQMIAKELEGIFKS